MTKYKFLILAFLPFCLFADCADCEAYKTQVVNDCDSLLVECGYIRNTYSYIETYCNTIDNNVSSSSSSTILNATDNIRRNCSSGLSTVSAIENFVNSVKLTAQSVQCNASSNTVGSCDCSQYLQSLISLVQTCNQTLAGVSSGLDSVRSALGTTSPDLNSIIVTLNNTEINILDLANIIASFLQWDDSNGDVLYHIGDFYTMLSSITNSFDNKNIYYNFSDGMERRFPMFRMNSSGVVQPPVFYTLPTTFQKSGWNSTSFATALKYASQYLILQNISQLNLSYSNTIAIATIARKMDMLTNTVDISSITNLLEEKFTIFTPSSPLEIYTQGSEQNYYQFLTNYYIKVSTGGTLSPSEPHTNWFSRIEMLLASLVFKDEGTNFVDNAENTSELENTLSQSVDTLSQAVSLPQNVTGKIDNMGQSFLGLLGEWRAIVSGNSLPSQFVLCDINLSSQNRDSSADSSVSSFRLETSLDSGEFRQFLDFCHAITTILFTMLFVWLSIMLLSFLLSSLAKLAQFCYLVYSALFGG